MDHHDIDVVRLQAFQAGLEGLLAAAVRPMQGGVRSREEGAMARTDVDVAKLGKWPFEIGLWVGRTATPNRMGKKGDNDRRSARARPGVMRGRSR